MSSLLVLLLCLIAFLTYFPVPLVRNIRVHAAIFSAYFAVRTSLLFVVTLFGLETVRILNIVGQSPGYSLFAVVDPSVEAIGRSRSRAAAALLRRGSPASRSTRGA